MGWRICRFGEFESTQTFTDLENSDFRFQIWECQFLRFEKCQYLRFQIWEMSNLEMLISDLGNVKFRNGGFQICRFWRCRITIWEIEIVRFEIVGFSQMEQVRDGLFVNQWLWIRSF